MKEKISNHQPTLEGRMTVKDTSARYKQREKDTMEPFASYINHFKECSDFASMRPRNSHSPDRQTTPFIFGQILHQRVLNNMSQDVDKGDGELFDDSTYYSESDESVEGKMKSTLFKGVVAADTKILSKVSDDFLGRVRRHRQYKQKEVGHVGKGVIKEDSPDVALFKGCQKDHELAIPILERIEDQTLLLQEYNLTDGQVRALAGAIPYVDNNALQRLFIDNCGMTGDQLVCILKALEKLPCVRSLIYTRNSLSNAAINGLNTLLKRKPPFNLQELKLIDCNMKSGQIEALMTQLTEQDARLRVLALVNTTQTERSFRTVVEFLDNTQYLRELDLSWTVIRENQWPLLLAAVKDHSSLRMLNISHNLLLEKQSFVPSQRDRKRGLTEAPLTKHNAAVMQNFVDMLEMNHNLISLNLDYCGLFRQALNMLISNLHLSDTLQCIHLSGNMVIEAEFLDWIRETIPCKQPIEHGRHLERYASAKRSIQEKERSVSPMSPRSPKSPTRRRRQSIYTSMDSQYVDEERKWKQIRQGLLLKSINSARQRHETTGSFPAGLECQTLALTRQRGLDHVIPDAFKWKLLTTKKDECWLCEEHVITLYIWTPRIGLLSMVKDEEEIRYYSHWVADINRGNEPRPPKEGEEAVPHIASATTDWRYVPMQEIRELCRVGDTQKPNFLRLAIRQGYISEARAEGNLTVSD